MKIIFLSLFLIIFYFDLSDANIYVQNKKLFYGGQQIFLSGANIAWVNYANDFGNGAYWGVKTQYQSYIDEVANNGGNVIRVWVHIDGSHSPQFDGSGYATGADTNSLISELGALLDYAASKNVFVIPVLWNLAVKPTQNVINLFWDDSKLNQYLNKVLIPLALQLQSKSSLAAIEIINEPGGSISPGTQNSNPCFDTTNLSGTGANWAGTWIPVQNVQRLINLSTAAIKSVAPNILVTVGEWTEYATTNICSQCRNYYTDTCLIAAGGQASGKLDFYQTHTYTWNGAYSWGSPFHQTNANYNLDKPLVVGEFATVCSEDTNPANNYLYLYNAGYAGALSWQYNEGGQCSDTRLQADQGMQAIQSQTSNGKIRIQF